MNTCLKPDFAVNLKNKGGFCLFTFLLPILVDQAAVVNYGLLVSGELKKQLTKDCARFGQSTHSQNVLTWGIYWGLFCVEFIPTPGV